MYKVLKYVQDHLHEHVTVEDAARECGYSQWYFCKMFRAFAGTSFIAYVNHKKMQNAAIDLLSGEKVLDTALKYGYETAGGFNKAFLCEFGCYPKEFRKTDEEYRLRYKERRDRMFPLSDRCAILRKKTVEEKEKNKYAAFTFHLYYNRALRAMPENTPNTILRAEGVRYTASHAPAHIEDGELIVGYNFGEGSEPRKNVVGTYCLIDDKDEEKRIMLENGFTEEEIAFYNSDRNTHLRYHKGKDPDYTPYEKAMDREWTAIGRAIVSDHGVLDYRSVLELGFEGLRKKVEKYEAKNGSSDMYEAMKMLCEAGCSLGRNYAVEAERLLADPSLLPERRAELEKMRDVCTKVPAKPAGTFLEAVQSLWFAHILTTWEDTTTNANSLGRLDRILYPYYRRDIDSGVLTREQAFEIICCLWIKLYRDYDVQQSCVGGCDENGNDATNELSYMMLDATEQLGFIRCLSVRYGAGSSPDFVKRALEVVGHLRKGVPFFFNDDVMIPALVSGGISLPDARDYTQIGCVETVIPGKSNPHAVAGEVNVLKALEFTLNDGRSMLSGFETEGFAITPTKELTDYEALEKEVFRHIRNILDVSCRTVRKQIEAAVGTASRPYKSLLTEGCVERNLDFNDHGAKYDYYQIMVGGLPNLADSLIALKKLVFEEKRYTLDEVIGHLRENFPDETVRLEFLNKAPKYGNDIDEVDEIAVRAASYACDCLEELSKKYGYTFHAQLFTYFWLIDHGRNTAATPDGRRSGDPIAYSVSPMQGRDYEGLTAVFSSLVKFPTRRTPGTASAIVEVDPQLLSDRNLDKLTALMLALAGEGLSNVQFNITDAETLTDAQLHPENHRNLAVRVSGFSQKFSLLDKDLQDHIIARTKHKCL